MAYLYIEENKINGCGEVPAIDETTINYEITDEFYLEFQENPDKYIWDIETQEPVIDADYEQKQAEKEAERVAKLTMTSLDFINFLEASGLTLEEITAWLDMPENLRVKTQLMYCQNVYCGVACSLMPIQMNDVEITTDMVIQAFKAKYGE